MFQMIREPNLPNRWLQGDHTPAKCYHPIRISLKAALHTSVSNGSGALHNAVAAVANAIESGSTLAAAIAKHSMVFPRFDTAVIEVAEMSGNAAVSAMLQGGVQSVRQGLPVSKGFSSAVPLDFKTL